MKTAYSYQRWSTVGQSAGDSKTRQTTSFKEWMEKHGKPLGYTEGEETFIDAGKSGYKGKHLEKDEYGQAKGELARFIQCVESGKIKSDSILCIDEFSRFSRMPVTKSMGLFLYVINSGIGLAFTGSYEKRILTPTLINNEPHLLQMILGEMIRSTKESEEKSRKVKAAKQSKLNDIRNGAIVRTNAVPNYFSFTSKGYVHNDKTPIVKELIDGILAGKTLYSMAGNLAERKVKPLRYGKFWSGNSIRSILRNRVLIGEVLGRKNYVPSITDEHTFAKVQNILDGNRKFNAGQRGQINIFRGICFCSACGSPMAVMSSKRNGQEYRYLRCNSMSNGDKGKCNHAQSFPLDSMEQEFFLTFLTKYPESLLSDDGNKEVKELKKQIVANESRISTITADLKRLAVASDIPEFAERATALNKERDTAKSEIDRLNGLIATYQDTPETFDDIKKLLADLNDNNTWKLNQSAEKIIAMLKDEYTREGLRVRLPALIGKITVDTEKGHFYIFNRVGKLVYTSMYYESRRNTSELWRASLEKYTTRKLANGRVIKLNRKSH